MAKNNKKERKNRLKSLILLLFLTIVLLSTSTYAWFTANRSVSIDPIHVQIAASSGLQISTNASDWKTLITNTDITGPTGYTGHTNQFPGELAPVSTAGTITSGKLNFFKGLVEGDDDNGGAMSLTASATPAEAAGTSGDYIAFDIFLKVDDASGADIFLTNGSGVLPTSTTVEPSSLDKGLQNAARYAFVFEGNGASNTQASTAQGWTGGTNATWAGGSQYVMVEPNYDAHKASGVSNASTYYSQSTTAAESGVAYVPYKGVKAAISSPIILVNTNPGGTPSTDYFQDIATLYKTNVAYSNAGTTRAAYKGTSAAVGTAEAHLLKIFHLPTGVTKLRVYMWVEGQDIDCENAASGSFLTYKLGLTLDDEE